jgi:hypothetical protein
MATHVISSLELWRAYRQSKDPALRERLVEADLALVKYLAARIASRLPKHLRLPGDAGLTRRAHLAGGSCMLLSIFVITQIALDIALVTYLLTNARRRRAVASARRAQPAAAPPSWYGDFLATAEELMVLVEPVLDLAEGGRLAGGSGPPSPAPGTEARPAESARTAIAPPSRSSGRERHRKKWRGGSGSCPESSDS